MIKKDIFRILSIMVFLGIYAGIAFGAPAPPTNVSASDVANDNGGKINVTWIKSTDDGSGGNNVTGYDILRSTSAAGPFSSRGSTASGVVFFTDLTTDGINYYYMVNSTDGNNSSGSGVFGPVKSQDDLAPVISLVSSGTVTDSSAIITWTTNEPATSTVRYGTAPSSYSSSNTSTTPVTSHSITLLGLSANTTYYYVVNSTDAGGNSNQSAERNFTTAPDSTNPTVSSTNPIASATNVPLASTVTATGHIE